eukprot:gene6308-8526_t
MSTRAFITGVSGLELTTDERSFLRSEQPWGFILFKRNIDTPAQVSALVKELRDIVGRDDAPVLIDQEGGRVQRLGPPHWPVYPPGAVFGTLYDIDAKLGLDAARLSSRLIAADLIDLGITVDCLPLADVPVVLCIGFFVFSLLLEKITDYKLSIFGVMILFVVYYLPEGIVGFLKGLAAKLAPQLFRPHTVIKARGDTAIIWAENRPDTSGEAEKLRRQLR